VLLHDAEAEFTNKHKYSISTMVSYYLNEEKDKIKRHLNLVIHNLKESSSEDGST